jgi:hypothetical protein
MRAVKTRAASVVLVSVLGAALLGGRASGRPQTAHTKPKYVGAGYSAENDPEHWEWNNPDLFLHFFVYEGKLSPGLLPSKAGLRYPLESVAGRSLGD